MRLRPFLLLALAACGGAIDVTAASSAEGPEAAAASVPDAAPTAPAPSGDFVSALTFPIAAPRFDEGVVVAFDGSSNLFVAYSSAAADPDVVLLKIDPSGRTVWSRTYAGVGPDVPLALATDASGDVYLSMQLSGARVFKIRGGDGGVLDTWAPAMDDGPRIEARCPTLAVDGDAVAVECAVGSGTDYDYSLSLLDLPLSARWTIAARGSAQFNDDGNVMSGFDVHARTDGRIIREPGSVDLDVDGPVHAIVPMPYGQFAAGGKTSAGAFITRLAADGRVVRKRRFHVPDDIYDDWAEVNAGARDRFGDLVWVGRYTNGWTLDGVAIPDPPALSWFIMKTDAKLNVLWTKAVTIPGAVAQTDVVSLAVNPANGDIAVAASWVTNDIATGFVVRYSR